MSHFTGRLGCGEADLPEVKTRHRSVIKCDNTAVQYRRSDSMIMRKSTAVCMVLRQHLNKTE